MLNHPYAWIGLARTADGLRLEQFEQLTGNRVTVSAPGPRVHLRVHCDFDEELAQFSYRDAEKNSSRSGSRSGWFSS